MRINVVINFIIELKVRYANMEVLINSEIIFSLKLTKTRLNQLQEAFNFAQLITRYFTISRTANLIQGQNKNGLNNVTNTDIIFNKFRGT